MFKSNPEMLGGVSQVREETGVFTKASEGAKVQYGLFSEVKGESGER